MPTHLDSHHHTHSFGSNQEVVIALAQKYDLPVRGNFERSEEVRHVDYFEPYFDDVGEKEVKKRQISTSVEDYLKDLYKKLQKDQTIEVMCHTAYLDQELLEGSSFIYPRMKQVEFLIHSPFVQKVKKDPLIELTTYKTI